MKIGFHQQPTARTLAWVTGAHVLIMLIAFIIPTLLKPKAPEKFIELVPLGSLNPGEGKPDSSDLDSGGGGGGGGFQEPQPVAEKKPLAPVIKAVDPVPPQPVKEIIPVVKKTVPEKVVKAVEPIKEAIVKTPEKTVEKIKPLPPQDKPKVKAKIVPNLTVVNKSGQTANPSASSSNQNKSSVGAGQGLSASDVENKLRGKFGPGSGAGSGPGKGNAGVENGTGQGRLGDPNGVANAPWYDTYIGNQLKQNWVKPTLSGSTIEAWASVRIFPDGSVQFLKLNKSSGVAEMDQSVIAAIESVQKLGTPPPKGLPNPYDRVVKFEL